MAKGISDMAVGAILEIPTQALADITKAENAIKKLSAISAEAAGQVRDHWGVVAPHGLQQFIDKLTEAQRAMRGLGNEKVNINVNTQPLEQSLHNVANTATNTATSVSQAVQTIALERIDFSNMNALRESILGINATYEQLDATIKKAENSRNRFATESVEAQDYTNKIQLLKEYLSLRKKSEEQLKSKTTDADKNILTEQKRLLAEQLDLRKRINEQKIRVVSGEVTGSSKLAEERDALRQLSQQYNDTRAKLERLNEAKMDMSTAGAAQYELAAEKQTNTLLEVQMKYRQDLNKELVRANELTSQAQVSKSRLGNTEEAAIQRQLNSDYKNMLRIIREQGELKAKVASEGRQMTQQEIALVTALAQRYKVYYDDVNRISGAYTKMADASAKAFQADKSEQMARNAIMLADAQKKAVDVVSRYPTLASSILDTSTVEQKKREFINAIRSIEAEIAQMSPKFQEALTAKWNAKSMIDSMTIKDIQTLQQQIEQLGRSMIGLSQAQGGGFHPNMQPVLDAINQLRGQITQIKTESANMLNTSAEAQEVQRLLQAYDQLYERIRKIQEQQGHYDAAKVKLDAVNEAIQQQIKKITDNEAEIERLNQAFARLNAVQKAYDANGNLTTQAKNIYDKIEALKEENKLLKMNASEAGKSNASKMLAEYKRLQSELERINKLMDDLRNATGSSTAAGGTAQASQFNAYVGQRQAIQQQIRDIEIKNIQEVEQYRQQLTAQSLQADLSAFVQNEAAKTAAARQAAEQQSNDRIQAYQKFFTTYQGAMEAANRLGTRGGKWEDTYENRERVIKNLEEAIKKLKTTDADYERQLTDLKSKLQSLKKAQEDVNKAMAMPKSKTTFADAQRSVQIANTTKALRDYEQAYKDLKAAMAGMDTSDPRWAQMNTQLQQAKKNIDDIKKEMGELQSQTAKTSNAMGQLQSRIAAAFSIAAISGFIKKMVDTRAQFELQRVALGAIIQNRDEANKIFLQVQQMALQSPFSIMQLERATKQIAAFGFEAKKLVPTMKMFADISAGLGVEIDRLVLVMGHLKARNFLEGTMVRQFTNMGFNVLGNLATYYSDLEKRMVSVAEVQERVKKKMVSFSDVEEVLKRVTSAGGMFYDMQKKQSDSLWGQMQRITDAYDLMLNEIGQSNEGSIKAALTAIRTLINSWRELKPWIIAAIAAMGSYMTVAVGMKVIPLLFANITKGVVLLKAALTGAKTAQELFNLTVLKNPYAAVASAIIAVITLIWQLVSAQDALTEAMERNQKETLSDMFQLMYRYRELADTVASITTPYKERKEALEELNRTYKDILPQELLEIDNIKKMAGAYDEATEAIRAYSLQKLQQKQQELISDEMIKAMDVMKNKYMDKAGDFAKWNEKIKNVPEEQIKGTINNIFTIIESEVIAGTLKIEDARQEFFNRFAKFYDLDKVVVPNFDTYRNTWWDAIGVLSGGLQSLFTWDSGVVKYQAKKFWSDFCESINPLGFFKVVDPWNDLTAAFGGLEHKYGEFVNQMGVYETEAERQMAESAQGQIDSFKKISDEIQAFKSAYEDLYDLNKKGGLYNDDDSYTNMGWSAMQATTNALYPLNEYLKSLGKAPILISDITAALSNNVAMQEMFGNVATTVLSEFNERLKETAKETGNTYLQGFSNKIDNAINEMSGTEVQKKFNTVTKALAGMYKVGVEVFEGISVTAESSYSDVRKQAEQSYKDFEDRLKRYQTALENFKKYAIVVDPEAAARDIAGLTEEQVSMAETILAVFKALGSAFGSYEKSTGGKGTDEKLKKWQDLKKAIEDVSTAYDKYRKSFTVEESNKRIEELFGNTFAELGYNIKQFYKDGKYDADALIDALEVLLGMTNATTVERKKFRSELQSKIGTTEVEIEVKLREDAENQLKKDLDEMFDNYSLTKEFKKMGLSIDLTYMVGGKPTTIEDIRKEIDRLRNEGGGDADAENRIKILEEAEKKLTQIIVNEQKERIKSYEKYLKKMYSERGKIMIESYNTMSQMEADFQNYIQTLEAEMNAEGTTDERKAQLATMIASLRAQASEAAIGIQRELSEALAKADWNSFKGSEIFESMYQDLDMLSKKGIEELITRLEVLRTKLQSISDVDPKAIREITQYIEKLKSAQINLSPYTAFKEGIAAAKALKKEYGSLEAAQLKLVELNDISLSYETQIADLETIQHLLDNGKEIKGEDAEATARLTALYAEYGSDIPGTLKNLRDMKKTNDADANTLKEKIDAVQKTRAAYEKQKEILDQLKNSISKAVNAAFDLADAFGADIDDEWKNLATTFMDAVFQAIALQLQMKMLEAEAPTMGAAMNSALGIIGWIATALQVVASLLMAIFASHDKRLQKQIEALQEDVDNLSKAFDKLQKSIERAFTIGQENNLTEETIDNLEEQKRKYEEMMRLEEAKKKTDKDKLKEYQDKIDELNDTIDELYETRHEKWGSTNSAWDEANNWVDAWLDAFKEAGDGLDSLNQSWDDFYENLVKKQAASAVLGTRMKSYIEEINNAIDKTLGSEYDYIDMFKDIGERMKKEFSISNEQLKKIFEYAGIGGGAGELLLSDLQKGIQNITEPQAAAIEAYLNSMRFAVFRHTEQLDTLIASVQMQYGSSEENPIVAELKGIRIVLDSIDRRLSSVIKSSGVDTYVHVS